MYTTWVMEGQHLKLLMKTLLALKQHLQQPHIIVVGSCVCSLQNTYEFAKFEKKTIQNKKYVKTKVVTTHRVRRIELVGDESGRPQPY